MTDQLFTLSREAVAIIKRVGGDEETMHAMNLQVMKTFKNKLRQFDKEISDARNCDAYNHLDISRELQ